MNFIYALHDPTTGERRYIGKAKDTRERYRKHLLPYYLKPETYKNRWLRKLLRAGLRPVMVILCEAAEWEDIDQIERDFIRWLRGASRLTNGTLGGDGGATMTGRKMPPRGPSPMLGIRWRPDDPRREQLRTRQRGRSPMHATAKATIANTERWLLTSPNGETHELVGLNPFCAEHGLAASKMSAVARGEANRTHHKGWRCKKLEDPRQADEAEPEDVEIDTSDLAAGG